MHNLLSSILSEPLGSDQPKKNGVCHCILGKIYTIIHQTILNIYVDIKDHNSIFKECKIFSTDWIYIGSALGIKKSTLDMIKKDNNQCKDMMFDMLASWLKRENIEQPPPTWNNLVRAVSDSVGIRDAQNIAKEFVCTHV